MTREVGGIKETLTYMMNAINNLTIQNRNRFIPNREGTENLNFEENLDYGSEDGDEEEYKPRHQLVNRGGRNGRRDAGHGIGCSII